MNHVVKRNGRRMGGSMGAVRGSRRGVAMLLVIVSLTIAIVLTTAMLASRDNSSAIGVNAQNAAAAGWGAESGARYAVAVLETAVDWRAALEAADGATLMQDFMVGDALVSVRITTPSGDAPGPGDDELLLTAVARVGGMEKTVQKLVTVRPDVPVEDAADPALTEFTGFVAQNIEVSGNSVVGVWDKSPNAAFTPPAKLGGKFATSADVYIGADAELRNVHLYVESDAPASVRDLVDGPSVDGGAVIPLVIPMVNEAPPAEFASLPNYWWMSITATRPSDSFTLGVAARFDDVLLENEAVLTLDASKGAYYRFDDVRVHKKGVLRIVGDVSVMVDGDLEVRSSGAIVLADEESSVRFYLKDDLVVDDAGVGLPVVAARNKDRTPESIAAYDPPNRVQFFSVSSTHGGENDATWELRKRSVVLGVLNAPNASVCIKETSALIGRVTARDLSVLSASSLLYDSSLDPGTGFTALSGPLYQNGEPISGLVEAINGFDWNLGYGAWQAYLTALVQSGVISGNDPLAGGGGKNDPTPRSDARAESREVARSAFLYEIGLLQDVTDAVVYIAGMPVMLFNQTSDKPVNIDAGDPMVVSESEGSTGGGKTGGGLLSGVLDLLF